MKPVKNVKMVKTVKKVPSPTLRVKRRLATPADLVEVQDTNLLLSIDLKRQPDDLIGNMEIEEGQRLFPFSVASRLMIGWQQVSFISSFEMRLSSEHPLPGIVIRFVEKMSQKDIEKMDETVKSQIFAQIALVRQYPFVTVESPLLNEAPKKPQKKA